MFNAGDLVAGKFQIERVIGRGGMGFVVAATHVHLGQRVALKFLLPEVASDRAIVERFLREARSSAQLRGEHICRVSDVGVLDGGTPYFVMELLEGRDLASLLAERGPFPIPVLTEYMLQACLGLAEAHAARIVHRDLKPANLFLTVRPDGTPLIKIVDFGIAKDAASANFQLTRTDAVMGSPGYMSPEQLRSSRLADARSDIWALGVMLFELATGRPPFTAESITDLALRIAVDPTPPLRAAAPPGFDRVVYRCLEKDPARRFQDIAQLAAALAPFGPAGARDRALGVARVLSATAAAGTSTPAVAVPAAPTTLGSSAASLERHRGDRLRWGVVLGGLAVGVLATVAVIKLRGDHAPAAADVDPATQATQTTPATQVKPETQGTPAAPTPTPTPMTPAAQTMPATQATSATQATQTTPTAPATRTTTAAPATQTTPAAQTASTSHATPAAPTAPTTPATQTAPTAQATSTTQTTQAPPTTRATPAAPATSTARAKQTTQAPSTTGAAAGPHASPSPSAAQGGAAAPGTRTGAPAPGSPTTRPAGGAPPDAGIPVDAAPRPDVAPPVRKVTRPRPPPKDDDIEGSRL